MRVRIEFTVKGATESEMLEQALRQYRALKMDPEAVFPPSTEVQFMVSNEMYDGESFHPVSVSWEAQVIVSERILDS